MHLLPKSLGIQKFVSLTYHLFDFEILHQVHGTCAPSIEKNVAFDFGLGIPSKYIVCNNSFGKQIGGLSLKRYCKY